MATLTSYEGSNDDYENTGTTSFRAMGFQFQTTDASVTGASFFGSKGNGATGTFKVILVSTLGGSELATTGTLNTSTLTAFGANDWNPVTFTVPYAGTFDTQYHIVVMPLSGSTSDEVRWSADTTSPTYAYGTSATSTDNVTWTPQATIDRNFRVTGTVNGGGPTNLKSLNTNVKANVKSYDTNVIANVKSINTNT